MIPRAVLTGCKAFGIFLSMALSRRALLDSNPLRCIK